MTYSPGQLNFVEAALIEAAENQGPIQQWRFDRRMRRPRARERLVLDQAAKLEAAGLLPENPETAMLDEGFMQRVLDFLIAAWPMIMKLAELFSGLFR